MKRITRIGRVLFALSLLLAVGCAKNEPKPLAKPGQTWKVYYRETEVMILKNEPGPLVSMAYYSEGGGPPMHPFLSATSTDIREEGILRVILEKSENFEDYLVRLKAEDYVVKPG